MGVNYINKHIKVMQKNKPKYLAYRQEDEEKFQEEVANLSIRAKKVLEYYGLTDWQKFYKSFLVDRELGEFDRVSNSGELTKSELLAMARRILNINGYYTKELEKFESEKKLLNPRTRTLMKRSDISLFETFYYTIVIQKTFIDFSIMRYRFLPEIYCFIESYCTYLGVEAPKKKIVKRTPLSQNDSFIEKKVILKFYKKYQYLSPSTREFLAKQQANSYYSFYNSYISQKSPLYDIFNELGESALIEVLRYRQMLEDYKTKLEIGGNTKV